MTVASPAAPPIAERQKEQPTEWLHYVIDGRPGKRYPTLEAACQEAADLVRRLRLSQAVKVREAGSDRIVAMAGQGEDGRVHIVRFAP